MYKKENLLKLLVVEAPGRLVRVQMTGPFIEVGKKYHQVHAHFNLSIEHTSRLLLKDEKSTINRRFKAFFDTIIPWKRGCHFNATLLASSATKNYNQKKDAHRIESIDVKDTNTDSVQPTPTPGGGDTGTTGENTEQGTGAADTTVEAHRTGDDN